MKLTANKINQQLSKGLSPIYFISGEDPLLAGEVADAIRVQARRQGYDERESHSADAKFDWQSLRAGLDNLSLFASRKIVEIRLTTGKPGREGGAAIVELVADPPADTLFIITAPKADAKAKWVKTLEKDAVWVAIRMLTPEQLPGWLANRMQAAGLSFDQEAIEILAARVEGNLLAAQQEISKLVLLADGQQVTAEIVQQSVADGARFDVFQLADAAVGQDVTRAIRILYGLRKEGIAPALTLWALAREASLLVSLWSRVQQGASPGQAMNEARVWNARQALLSKALHNHDERSVRRLAAKMGLTDRIVKGASPGQPWNALLELLLCLAQPQQVRLAGYEV
ncbi:MAG: DNA polymerase III subunit delta [Gammaproteobacteria bacterium]|nr:DNA polymerase III subunit delta [Gammaproteobacteria bacterium]MCP4089175.1 DNA polymerase III subunit delta [Gammaproteobacteria bacterium]MCP4276801.1 DNA polymerase III subunit delta [Gammaproteobacteria bacterium]MCP4830644.1 DNA polymerase III subunit delta [Gammaproteobacteria bacterium]MCP4928453.1 DNA polymerase III subunit delta [Gammaproteobacteria bacterium]